MRIKSVTRRRAPASQKIAGNGRKKLLAIAGLCLFASSLMSAQLNPQQAIGKQIFSEGSSSSSSPIEAILGGGTSRIPGRLMPCASCHGTDGQGKPEGGITPSNITWDTLERALTSSDPLARRRPAYDEPALRRAITEGIDSAGNELGLTMPRFRMSDQDLGSLISYLRVLGKESDPGLTNSAIRVGTIIPADGPLAATGNSFASLLEAYFAEMNREGGIYGRKIELARLQVKGTPSQIATAARNFVREKNVFAILGVVAPGAEQDIEDSMQQAGVPVITAFATGSTRDDSSEKSKVFYVLSGLSQESRVLVRFARERLESIPVSIAVVFPEHDQQLADSVLHECQAQAFTSVAAVKYSSVQAESAEIVDSLKNRKVNAIFFLGDGRELHHLLTSAQKANWFPSVFQPGGFAGQDVFEIPEQFNQQVYFSFPVLPSDMAADALREYETLVRAHAISIAQPVFSTSAVAAAKVMVEALREAGRQLSRQKLVETLSAMYNFNTGLTPPVTFGATKRIGALGSYVVKLDLKNKTLLQVDQWMTP